MCTVSFVSVQNQFVITSNREEHVVRRALPPKNRMLNGRRVIFPDDPKSGGTWFVTRNDGCVLVLLNGAAQKHQRKAR